MSNFLNYSIQEKTELAAWMLRKMGHPLITIEITQDQLTDAINESVEFFTKYVQFDRQAYAMDLTEYVEDVGILMPDNVAGIFALTNQSNGSMDVNTLFSIPNQMMNAGLLPMAGGNGMAGGGWLSYEMARQYIDLTNRMIHGGSQGFQFQYNERTKLLKLQPDPAKQHMSGSMCVSCNVLRPDEQIFGEDQVKRLALANAKMQVGINRTKFSGVQLLAGGNVENQMYAEGKAEKEAIENDIKMNQGTFAFYVG